MNEITQNSDEWLALKAGKFSASRAQALLATGRGGKPSATRANLIADIVAERMTGNYSEGFKSAAMERGNEVEQEAREAYSFDQGVAIETVPFVEHPTIPNCGASPDGLVGDDGLVEFKCPVASARHLAALTSGAHATEHMRQCQFQMMCTGRRWVDVVSYYPEFPRDLSLAITRVPRDEDMILEIVGAIAKAEAEVQAITQELEQIRKQKAS